MPVPVPSMTISASAEPPLSISATVIGSRVTPTGLVNFSDGATGVQIGSAILTPSTGVASLANYPLSNGFPEAMCAGDFNQDGTDDLALVNGSNIIIQTTDPNTGQLTLSQTLIASSGAPIAIATADFNGDGLLDLATANSDGSVSVFFGDASQPGQFQSAASYATANSNNSSILVADFNQDGLPDLAIIGTQTLLMINMPGSPGTFVVGPPTGPSATVAAVADFNRDGYPDVAIVTSTMRALGRSLTLKFTTAIRLIQGTCKQRRL